MLVAGCAAATVAPLASQTVSAVAAMTFEYMVGPLARAMHIIFSASRLYHGVERRLSQVQRNCGGSIGASSVGYIGAGRNSSPQTHFSLRPSFQDRRS